MVGGAGRGVGGHFGVPEPREVILRAKIWKI